MKEKKCLDDLSIPFTPLLLELENHQQAMKTVINRLLNTDDYVVEMFMCATFTTIYESQIKANIAIVKDIIGTYRANRKEE